MLWVPVSYVDNSNDARQGPGLIGRFTLRAPVPAIRPANDNELWRCGDHQTWLTIS